MTTRYDRVLTRHSRNFNSKILDYNLIADGQILPLIEHNLDRFFCRNPGIELGRKRRNRNRLKIRHIDAL